MCDFIERVVLFGESLTIVPELPNEMNQFMQEEVLVQGIGFVEPKGRSGRYLSVYIRMQLEMIQNALLASRNLQLPIRGTESVPFYLIIFGSNISPLRELERQGIHVFVKAELLYTFCRDPCMSPELSELRQLAMQVADAEQARVPHLENQLLDLEVPVLDLEDLMSNLDGPVLDVDDAEQSVEPHSFGNDELFASAAQSQETQHESNLGALLGEAEDDKSAARPAHTVTVEIAEGSTVGDTSSTIGELESSTVAGRPAAATASAAAVPTYTRYRYRH
ncbi:hypothetical protein [Parasitella parasitica]|uniref:Uncharacterized protein n=1 Tax=Parasitella parasitica TaxID=35722 RepID=A0A0B7NEX6_9FUNG|nr:hypothetical protein [Parasitella parasitica]